MEETYGVSRSGRPFRIFLDAAGRRRSRFLPMPSFEDMQPHLTTPAPQYLFAVAYARGFTSGRTVGLAERDRLMGKLLRYMSMRELEHESGLSEPRVRRILRDRAGLDEGPRLPRRRRRGETPPRPVFPKAGERRRL